LKKTILIFSLFPALVVLISFSVFWIGKNATKYEAVKVQDCRLKGNEYIAEIKNDQIAPAFIDTTICDQLTVINKDDKLRLVAFGVHDSHITYDGIVEKVLKKDESLTITLNQAGTYLFHDHLQEEVQAQFRVE
jgi:hypothetical protein